MLETIARGYAAAFGIAILVGFALFVVLGVLDLFVKAFGKREHGDCG